MVEAPHSEIPVPALAALCRFRWSVPVLGALWRAGGGGRFVVLAQGLAAPRSTLSRTLNGLIAQDLILHNPGYGHPLRPEYLLTPFGEAVGPAAADLAERLARGNLESACLRRWSLPVLAAVAGGAGRFGEILGAAPGLTPRALTLALRDLERAGLVERRVLDLRPPRVLYALTRRGRALTPSIVRLARAAMFDPG